MDHSTESSLRFVSEKDFGSDIKAVKYYLPPCAHTIHSYGQTESIIQRRVSDGDTEHNIKTQKEFGDTNQIENKDNRISSFNSKIIDEANALSANIPTMSGYVQSRHSTDGRVLVSGPRQSSVPDQNPANCRRRKSSCPIKSASKDDPEFRGVVFQFKRRLKGEQCYLDIEQLETFPLQRRRRWNSGEPTDTESSSESDDEPVIERVIQTHMYTISGKMCASCSTHRTPLWRDAEDGTPLCNACGIRYKKYHIRCSRCWSIPKKDNKSFPHCPSCGALLRVTPHAKRSTLL